jgi:hypothetical protein
MKNYILILLLCISINKIYSQNKSCFIYYSEDSGIVDTIYRCSKENYYIELKHGEVTPILFGSKDKYGFREISNFLYLINLEYFNREKYFKYKVFFKYDKCKDVILIKTVDSVHTVTYQEYKNSGKVINEKYLRQE